MNTLTLICLYVFVATMSYQLAQLPTADDIQMTPLAQCSIEEERYELSTGLGNLTCMEVPLLPVSELCLIGNLTVEEDTCGDMNKIPRVEIPWVMNLVYNFELLPSIHYEVVVVDHPEIQLMSVQPSYWKMYLLESIPCAEELIWSNCFKYKRETTAPEESERVEEPSCFWIGVGSLEVNDDQALRYIDTKMVLWTFTGKTVERSRGMTRPRVKERCCLREYRSRSIRNRDGTVYTHSLGVHRISNLKSKERLKSRSFVSAAEEPRTRKEEKQEKHEVKKMPQGYSGMNREMKWRREKELNGNI